MCISKVVFSMSAPNGGMSVPPHNNYSCQVKILLSLT